MLKGGLTADYHAIPDNQSRLNDHEIVSSLLDDFRLNDVDFDDEDVREASVDDFGRLCVLLN